MLANGRISHDKIGKVFQGISVGLRWDRLRIEVMAIFACLLLFVERHPIDLGDYDGIF